MRRLPRQDASGERLRVGDTVRVVGVPGLAGLSAAGRAESLPVFEYLVGKYKRVVSFDESGFAWLRFRIRGGPHAGLHCVAIEPRLLKLRRPRREGNAVGG